MQIINNEPTIPTNVLIICSMLSTTLFPKYDVDLPMVTQLLFCLEKKQSRIDAYYIIVSDMGVLTECYNTSL